MITRLLPILLALAGLTGSPPQQAARPAPAAPRIYNETADARALLAKALELAEVDDNRVLINWGANDDARSIKFAEALRAPVVTRTRYGSVEYHVVNVNVGRLDKNLDLAKQYGVTLTAGALPALTVLDEHGKVLVQASPAEFASAGDPAVFDPDKIAAFFTKHQAPAPDAVAQFDAAVKRAKVEEKVVFVWYSAPW